MSATVTPGDPALRCTHADRDRVVELLKNAYADGRLDQAEFDARFDQTMSSRTYVELDRIVADLMPGAPTPPAAPLGPPLAPPTTEERLLAALAQATTFVPILVGPAVLLMTTGKRSAFVRHHAAGALNLQLTMLALTIVTFGLGGVVYSVAWILAAAFAVVALAGSPLRQPWVLPVCGRGGPYERR